MTNDYLKTKEIRSFDALSNVKKSVEAKKQLAIPEKKMIL